VKRIYAEVSGRVQGVGFRYFCKSLAETLGISGWVRNLPGGNVELEAQAETKDLEEFLRAVRQGAPGSLVKDVAERDIPPEKEEGEFDIRF